MLAACSGLFLMHILSVHSSYAGEVRRVVQQLSLPFTNTIQFRMRALLYRELAGDATWQTYTCG